MDFCPMTRCGKSELSAQERGSTKAGEHTRVGVQSINNKMNNIKSE